MPAGAVRLAHRDISKVAQQLFAGQCGPTHQNPQSGRRHRDRRAHNTRAVTDSVLTEDAPPDVSLREVVRLLLTSDRSLCHRHIGSR